ncbi:hypothetical protein RRG08_036528 [Elysia crispata]|uniref:Uncharacterized protein n=1 Tax=Elysia crispata TaxID=231223 RepID=A0AAE0YWC5_9GAST|nr:hypothetical protein RRG08_036528 [Elysia crispata]
MSSDVFKKKVSTCRSDPFGTSEWAVKNGHVQPSTDGSKPMEQTPEDSIDNNFVLWKSLDLLGAYEQPVNGLSRILMSQSSTDGSTPMEHAPEGAIFPSDIEASDSGSEMDDSIRDPT